jgi:hypothetical protein
VCFKHLFEDDQRFHYAPGIQTATRQVGHYIALVIDVPLGLSDALVGSGEYGLQRRTIHEAPSTSDRSRDAVKIVVSLDDLRAKGIEVGSVLRREVMRPAIRALGSVGNR